MSDAASVRVTTTKAALDALAAERDRYREALEKIAASRRPDGTYSPREACERIAKEALS